MSKIRNLRVAPVTKKLHVKGDESSVLQLEARTQNNKVLKLHIPSPFAQPDTILFTTHTYFSVSK